MTPCAGDVLGKFATTTIGVTTGVAVAPAETVSMTWSFGFAELTLRFVVMPTTGASRMPSL